MDSFESAFGPRPGGPAEPPTPDTSLPSFESAFGPRPKGPVPPPQSGPLNDAFWSWQGNKLGRIMTQFGQGAEQGWGAAHEYDTETTKALRDAGIYNPLKDAHGNILKAGNEAWMRPTLNALYGTVVPVLSSLSAGGQQIGKEIIGLAKEQAEGREDLLQQGHTLPVPDVLTKYVGGYGELTAATAAGQYFGAGSGIAPELISPTVAQATAATNAERTLFQWITNSRATGAIGEDIDVFLGSREPTFDEWQGRLRAIGDSPGAAAQPAVDIHQMAQMIAPDVFKRWQTLENNRDILTQHLEGLTALKARDETVSKLESKIERLAKKTEGPATPLNREDREALVKARADLETYHDTPSQDILDAKAALKRVQDERNQLAPDVKRAYQEAQGRVTPLDLTRSLEGETFNPADTVPPEAGKPSAVFSAVREQMLAAGRSEEEANAAALVTQHRYETRSKRFPQLGTAEEIFNKERLGIQAGEGKPGESKLLEGTVFDQNKFKPIEGPELRKLMDEGWTFEGASLYEPDHAPKGTEFRHFKPKGIIRLFPPGQKRFKQADIIDLRKAREEKETADLLNWAEVNFGEEDFKAYKAQLEKTDKAYADYEKVKDESDSLDEIDTAFKKAQAEEDTFDALHDKLWQQVEDFFNQDPEEYAKKVAEEQIEDILNGAAEVIEKAHKNNLPSIADKWTKLAHFVDEHKIKIFDDEELNNQYHDLKDAAQDAIRLYEENIKKPGENVVPLRKPGEVTLKQSKFIAENEVAVRLFEERFNELSDRYNAEADITKKLMDEFYAAAKKDSPLTNEEFESLRSKLFEQERREADAYNEATTAAKELGDARYKLKTDELNKQFIKSKGEYLQILQDDLTQAQTAVEKADVIFKKSVAKAEAKRGKPAETDKYGKISQEDWDVWKKDHAPLQENLYRLIQKVRNIQEEILRVTKGLDEDYRPYRSPFKLTKDEALQTFWKGVQEAKKAWETAYKALLDVREKNRPLFDEAEKTLDFTNPKYTEAYKERLAASLEAKESYTHYQDLLAEYSQAKASKAFDQEGARADITFQKDGQSVIRLFKNADSSSIFHELGHKWLEELRADAEHPQAPEQLKKDWATVKEFYGFKASKKATRTVKEEKAWVTAHENFARGFERYLMEGHAPSTALEAVFKQLKDWMTAIYKKLVNLKAPINDDIRAVMDRLLADDAAAVITGEDTVHVPPRSKKVITEPEGGDLAPKDQVEGANDELPSKGTYMQDDGKINDLDLIDSYKSIREAAKEFGELNAQAMNIRKGKLGKTDIVEISQLTSISPKRMEGLIDALQKTYVKDRVSPTKKVLFLGVFLKQNAARIKDIMEKPNATPKEMAKVIGWITQHKAAIETMLGIRTEWGLTGHALQALLEESLASGGDAAFNQSLLQHIGLTAQQIGLRLKMWKPKTTNQVSMMSRKIMDPTIGKSLIQYYINGLISGPFTHLQYALGNELTTIKNELVEPGLASAVGGVRSVLGNTGERVTGDEMVSRVHDLLYGTRDGLIAAGKAIKEGYQQGFDSDDLILAKVLEEIQSGKITAADKANRISELTNKVQTFNHIHDVADIAKDEERTITNLVRTQKGQKPIPLRIDPDLNEVFSIIERAEPPQSFYTESRENIAARKGVSGAVQHVINAPGERMVSPIHTVNYIQNLTLNLNGKITRAAYAEGRKNNWTQDQITQKITEMRIDPPLSMVRSAREEALASSLLSKPGDFWSKVNLALSHEFKTFLKIPGTELLGPTPYLKIAQPFVTISSLVWKGGSVLGRYIVPGGILIRKSVRDDMFGRNGKLAQDIAIGKAVAGYGLFWSLWGMSAEGLLNQGPAETYNENVYRTMLEGLPYGVRIGDMTYEAERLGPIGFYASIVSDLYHMKEKVSEGEYIGAVEEVMYQMGHHLTQTGPVSGIADLFESMKEPGRYGQAYVNQLLVALATPLSVGSAQIAHQIDPYAREVTTGGENITPSTSQTDAAMIALRNEMNRLRKQWIKNIPYASTSLYPQRDLFGQPMPNRSFVGVYALAVQKDPVFQALDKIGYFPAPIPKRIGNFTLTEEMYDKLASKAGILAHQLMGQAVFQPNFKQLPPGIQHKILLTQLTAARQAARGYLEAEYHDIAQTNAEFKAAILKPLPGEEPEGTQ